MKTIGETLKEARRAKRFSVSKLEKKTKIKATFIKSIEVQDWENLPESAVVAGFVRSLALALDLDPKTAAAVFKRDYPPKKVKLNPKPDVSAEFKWNPRLTFVVGALLIVLLVAGYLLFQYSSFVRPPNLIVKLPEQMQTITQTSVEVVGEVDPNSTLTINSQPVLIEENGQFNAQIEVLSGEQELEIIAKSRSGKQTAINRKIIVELP